MSLLPYMLEHRNSETYSAYIPFISTDPNFLSFTSGSVAEYLGLPSNRKEYNPSYFYINSNEQYEIGILGENKEKMLDAIKNIQQKLKTKNCIVNENFSSADELFIH